MSRTLEDVMAVVREQGVPRDAVDQAVAAHREHLRREPRCLVSGCPQAPGVSVFLSVPGNYLFIGSLCDEHLSEEHVEGVASRVAAERGAPACQFVGWVPVDVLLSGS